MARSFHRKKQLEALSELNVTALIDLGFALLIIFMISTPLIKPEQSIDVNLPSASPSTVEPPPEKVDVVVVDQGYVFDGDRLSEAQLENELRRLARMSKPPVLSIRADRDRPYQDVVRLMDLLKQYKLTRIHLVTQPED